MDIFEIRRTHSKQCTELTNMEVSFKGDLGKLDDELATAVSRYEDALILALFNAGHLKLVDE